MSRYASETGTGAGFQQAPVGTHVARAFKIIDIGTQHGEYQGKPTVRNQFVMFWEIPGELIDTPDGPKPAIASKFYTNSLNEKATLRADLEAWRGREFIEAELAKFDLQNVLGKPCMLTIVKGTNGNSKVSAVSGLPKGMICPEQANPTFALWLDEWNPQKFESLTDGLKKLIMRSDEYKELTSERPKHAAPISPKGRFDDMMDDIPF